MIPVDNPGSRGTNYNKLPLFLSVTFDRQAMVITVGIRRDLGWSERVISLWSFLDAHTVIVSSRRSTRSVTVMPSASALKLAMTR